MMNLTEEQAKEILDFLARRMGCLNCKLTQLGSDNNTYYLICYYKDEWGLKPTILYFSTVNKYVTSSIFSYIKVLKYMLKKSKNNNIMSILFRKPFLLANSTLENILIEMDLENAIR